ncbi:MAG TPA: PLDc N-terminal domain-containing protein [Actinomycetota bacterium]|nr:PLDc N-terminal domain-containing protein [Actinomycetota bacterium]
MLRYALPLLLLALWIWALVSAISVEDDSMYQTGNKLIWVLVILLAGPIGALIYWAIGKPVRAPRRQHRPPPDDLI